MASKLSALPLSPVVQFTIYRPRELIDTDRLHHLRLPPSGRHGFSWQSVGGICQAANGISQKLEVSEVCLQLQGQAIQCIGIEGSNPGRGRGEVEQKAESARILR